MVLLELATSPIGKDMLYDIYPDRSRQVLCTYWSHHMQQLDARRRWNTKFVANLLPAKIHELHIMNADSVNALEALDGAA